MRMKKMDTLTWVGRVIGVLAGGFVAFGGIIKLVNNSPEMLEGWASSGWPPSYMKTIGILEVACAAVYFIPKTSYLGAILMTGLIGGIIATNLRLENNVLVPVLLGVAVWASHYLRDPRLRSMIPLNK